MAEQVNITVTNNVVEIGAFQIPIEEVDADCDCTGACAGSRVIACANGMCICQEGDPEVAQSKGSVVLAAIAHAMRNNLGYIEFEGDIAELGELLSEYEQQKETLVVLQDKGLWTKGGLDDIRATMSKNLLRNSKFMAAGAVIKGK